MSDEHESGGHHLRRLWESFKLLSATHVLGVLSVGTLFWGYNRVFTHTYAFADPIEDLTSTWFFLGGYMWPLSFVIFLGIVWWNRRRVDANV